MIANRFKHNTSTLVLIQKGIQQINFTGNLSGNKNKVMFFVIKKANEHAIDFLKGTVKIYCNFFCFILISI